MVLNLCSLIDQALRASVSPQDKTILATSAVLGEYLNYHNKLPYPLPENLTNAIHKARQRAESTASQQQRISKEKLWQNSAAPFAQFAYARRSVRHFAGPAPKEQLLAALQLAALTYPSACNRQPCRTHVIENPDTLRKLFRIHSGTGGFGHTVQTLLAITVDLRYAKTFEHHDAYVNGGLYAMVLSYALTFHHVAHVIMNWTVTARNDLRARDLLDIPFHESIVLLVACGQAPDELTLCNSPRRDIEETYIFHNNGRKTQA